MGGLCPLVRPGSAIAWASCGYRQSGVPSRTNEEENGMAFTDLSSEQRQAFEKALKEYRVHPDNVIRSISPQTHSGPIVTSVDPKASTLLPTLVTVSSLDEVKRLAGNADADYSNGLMQENHEELDEWPAELNAMAEADLTAEQRTVIEKAEMGYIYGNSRKFQSYKHIIEKTKYPATFAIFAVEDLCLDASNSPYVVKSDSAHVFGTVTLCEGGSFKFEAGAVVTCQKMRRVTATKCSDVKD
jgi:hypothetical protein